MVARAAVLVAVSVISGLWVPPASAFTQAEQQCRDTIARYGGQLGKTALKKLIACHKKRDAGKLPPSTECNRITAADPGGKVDKAAANLSSRVSSKCAGLSPTTLGYFSCPSPCSSDVPSISVFDDVSACIVCLVKTASEGQSATDLGLPSVPLPRQERKCHGAIGNNARKHIVKILNERRRCQKASEAAGATDTSNCAGADPRGKIARTRQRGEDALERSCATADLLQVGSCSSNSLVLLKGCVFGDSSVRGEELFEAFYGLNPGSVTTTTLATTTTTVSNQTTTTLPPTTTTTLPTGQDPQCPNKSILTVLAGTGPTCSSNADCLAGVCDGGLGRCVTVTNLDTGFTGISHDADVDDAVPTAARLECPGQASPVPGQPCGECQILGLDPSTGSCRCADGQDCTTNADCPVGFCDTSAARPICKGGNRIVCDEPFQADANDCNGGICNCYFGPPLPLSAGNTPACVVNRFAQDISGTANVDTGEGTVETHLRSVVYLGRKLVIPCPYCTGDPVPGDGVRGGVCVFGENDGESCDAAALNFSFPAPGGDGHSLDCFPSADKNVSGSGLRIDINQTTGAVSLPAGIDCGNPADGLKCPCATCVPDRQIPCQTNSDCQGLSSCPIGSCDLVSTRSCASNADCQNLGPCRRKKCKQDQTIACTSDGDCIDVGPCNRGCTGDPNVPCASNADCVAADRCEKVNNNVPLPNSCGTGASCIPGPDGQGVCDPPLTETFCDAITRPDGRGFISCFSNADCSPVFIGIDAGNCTLTGDRRCFLDPIVAQGAPDPTRPVGAGVFCIPPTSSQGINSVAGLPGPARVVNQGYSQLFCASDPSVAYTPGVGGCP